MKLTRTRAALVGLMAVVILGFVVSPAIGGPSLRKLVKKEVAKQIAAATGPQGAQGPPGAPGAPGANGADITTLFGDGSDGDVTTSGNTTLSRDFYYDDLTINPGVTLNPGGFRIFVAGTLTLGNGAAIARNGNNGSGGAPGAGLTPGTLGGSGGGTGEGQSNSLGGRGIPASCILGTPIPGAVRPSASAGGAQVFNHALTAITGRNLDGQRVNGGGGSGGNGGAGDEGGSGGGVVVVAARRVSVNGAASITANGGNGPGGGGGGGVVVVVSGGAQPAGLSLSAQPGTGCTNDAQPGFTAWHD